MGKFFFRVTPLNSRSLKPQLLIPSLMISRSSGCNCIDRITIFTRLLLESEKCVFDIGSYERLYKLGQPGEVSVSANKMVKSMLNRNHQWKGKTANSTGGKFRRKNRKLIEYSLLSNRASVRCSTIKTMTIVENRRVSFAAIFTIFSLVFDYRYDSRFDVGNRFCSVILVSSLPRSWSMMRGLD